MGSMKTLNVKQTAEALGVSTSTLRIWVNMGAPHMLMTPGVTGCGRRIRFNPDDVLSWLKEKFGNQKTN